MGLGACAQAATFADDVDFLKQHVDTIVLTDASGEAAVAVCPAYQGRVMTSAASGPEGASFGWVNRDLIASGENLQHINPYGGEDRFWMGPEGGQYAIFFAKGVPEYTFDYWQTPAVIDTEAFETVEKTKSTAVFTRRALFPNNSGTWFDVQVDRTIRMLESAAIQKVLGVMAPSSVKVVAYESENILTNKGADPWTKEGGLLSIWILGMYNAAPETTIVVPFVKGDESELGPVVNDAYFGKVPADRLVQGHGVLYFRGDAAYRSKIGLSPKRSTPIMGSYDATAKALTIVQYSLPKGAEDYVNSMWELQDKPYAGDAANSYNDSLLGPEKKGLGAFYELESSSPAAALAPNESITHFHRTFHFEGPEADLDTIAKTVFGVSLSEVKAAFAK